MADTSTTYCTYAEYQDGSHRHLLWINGWVLSSMTIVGADRIMCTNVSRKALGR